MGKLKQLKIDLETRAPDLTPDEWIATLVSIADTLSQFDSNTSPTPLHHAYAKIVGKPYGKHN